MNHLRLPCTLYLWVRIPLVAVEVVEGHDRAEIDFLGPGIQVVSHPAHVAQLLAIGRRMLLHIELSWLLVQKEDVAVRRATRRWRRADVVGDERSGGVKVAGLGGLHSRLDPMQNGSEETE